MLAFLNMHGATCRMCRLEQQHSAAPGSPPVKALLSS